MARLVGLMLAHFTRLLVAVVAFVLLVAYGERLVLAVLGL